MALLKTWTNGWATSERFHEVVILPCIFGCGGHDSLAHYLSCQHLWSLLLSQRNAHTAALTHSPSQRACLCNVCKWSIVNCWVAFQAYHALKIDHRDVVYAAVESGDFHGVLCTVMELMALFCN